MTLSEISARRSGWKVPCLCLPSSTSVPSPIPRWRRYSFSQFWFSASNQRPLYAKVSAFPRVALSAAKSRQPTRTHYTKLTRHLLYRRCLREHFGYIEQRITWGSEQQETKLLLQKRRGKPLRIERFHAASQDALTRNQHSPGMSSARSPSDT